MTLQVKTKWFCHQILDAEISFSQYVLKVQAKMRVGFWRTLFFYSFYASGQKKDMKYIITKTRNREVRALLTASKDLKAKSLTIITLNSQEIIETDGHRIEVVSIIDWKGLMKQ